MGVFLHVYVTRSDNPGLFTNPIQLCIPATGRFLYLSPLIDLSDDVCEFDIDTVGLDQLHDFL